VEILVKLLTTIAIVLAAHLYAAHGFAAEGECVQSYIGWPRDTGSACVGGKQLEPLECCDIASDVLEARRTTEAFGDAAAPELLASYKTCGGPIGPFLVDDEDNVYFWSGRWQLHSIDENGEFRWRHAFCEPDSDPLCQLAEDCSPDSGVIPGTVMDYDGVLYFFIGDVLYAVDSDGERLLEKRITWQGVERSDDMRFFLSSGERTALGDWGSGPGGTPVLTHEGELVAYYINYTEKRQSEFDYFPSAGIVRLSRSGEVLDTYPFGDAVELGRTSWFRTRIVQLSNGEILFVSLVDYNDGGGRSFAAALDLETGDLTTLRLAPVDVAGSNAPEGLPEFPASAPAVAEDGTAYVYGTHGWLWAIETEPMRGKQIFYTRWPTPTHWQIRPIVDAREHVYITGSARYSQMWSLDGPFLWQEPFRKIYNEVGETDEDVPGRRWETQEEVYAASTPLLSDDGRIYVGLDGLRAFETDAGTPLWRFGEGTMGTAVGMLSDGTLVVGQGNTGHVYLLGETDGAERGLHRAGWPTAYHDRYNSNSALHPFEWSDDQPRPYPPLTEMLPDEPVAEADAVDEDDIMESEDVSDGDGAEPLDSTPGDSEPTDDGHAPTSKCSGCGTTDHPPTPMFGLLVAVVFAARLVRRFFPLR
jgi:outer membrane protein assembly factor BamB